MSDKPIVLFGTGKIAEVLLYYLRHSDRNVVAVTVDRDYLPGPTWKGLPVVPFDELEKAYPPGDHCLFIALGYQQLNELRERKCSEAKAVGYQLTSCIADDVPEDLEYGENCFVMPGCAIHPRVRLGDNVFVWSGAMIGHHSVIADHNWITSGANISGLVEVGKNCFLAVNSTIAHRVRVGDRCFIGANVLLTRCVGDEQVFLVESTKSFRLNSAQFLRMSGFNEDM